VKKNSFERDTKVNGARNWVDLQRCGVQPVQRNVELLSHFRR
jgi:hypothetical protein